MPFHTCLLPWDELGWLRRERGDDEALSLRGLPSRPEADPALTGGGLSSISGMFGFSQKEALNLALERSW